MKKMVMIYLGLLLGLNAAASGTPEPKDSIQLAVALQDSGISFGTDAATRAYPSAGMNTMPTKDVGNESKTYDPDAPAAKPFQAPAFSPPPPPAFTTPPAYTPPASQGGTIIVEPHRR
ncbi:MAG: hypothetical protein H0U70_13145 [Tatlockia sp.]|nr:hypothetical protein [Tatlockia sp.]